MIFKFIVIIIITSTFSSMDACQRQAEPKPTEAEIGEFKEYFTILLELHNELQCNEIPARRILDDISEFLNILTEHKDQFGSVLRAVQDILNEGRKAITSINENKKRIFDLLNHLFEDQIKNVSNIDDNDIRNARQTFSRQELVRKTDLMKEGLIEYQANISRRILTSIVEKSLSLQKQINGEKSFQNLWKVHWEIDKLRNRYFKNDDFLTFKYFGRVAGIYEDKFILEQILLTDYYKANTSSCNQNNKEYFQGLIGEVLFYKKMYKWLVFERMTNETVYENENFTRLHESEYYRKCGCTSNQTLINRDHKMSELWSMMTLDFEVSDAEFLRQLHMKNETVSFKIIGLFYKINFDNKLLTNLIREVPPEDIALMASTFLLNRRDAEATAALLKLYDDTFVCYSTGIRNQN